MLIGLLLVSLAAISWGTTGATMALLARDTHLSPLVVGWARLAVAAPVLLVAAGVAMGQRSRAALRVPGRGGADGTAVRSSPDARDVAAYVLLGLSMAAYQACYFRAVTLTGVAVTALVAICSAPIMIAILAALVLKESIGPAVCLSLGLAVVGTALLVVGPRAPHEMAGPVAAGVSLALGAGASYAVYAVTAKRVLAATAPLSVAAITFTLGALFLAPVLAGEPVSRADLARGAPLLLYLGLGPTALAYALFSLGLHRIPATAAGIASLLEPLTAATLGVLVFGESLGVPGGIGAGLLVCALILLAARRPEAGPR